jgi:hypothetical protein
MKNEIIHWIFNYRQLVGNVNWCNFDGRCILANVKLWAAIVSVHYITISLKLYLCDCLLHVSQFTSLSLLILCILSRIQLELEFANFD